MNTYPVHPLVSTPTVDATPHPPRLIFTSELGGAALLELLAAPGQLATLAAHGSGVALALPELDDARAALVRHLNAYHVTAVAWLMLPTDDGYSFNAQNYPQLLARYRDFRSWAVAHQLEFAAVGLEIAPPHDVTRDELLSARYLARRLWLAGDNVLFPAARAAYADLVAMIRHDGYEVHTYQWPIIADDRRAGTTLVQRALEIVDLPSDLDVLICASNIPLGLFKRDLGGALVASYGPAADAIGLAGAAEGALPWPALRRDLLLAARHTDIIYLDSLEGVLRRNLLPHLASINWASPAHAEPLRRGLVALLRGLALLTLLGARFGPRILAWAGWVLAALLWFSRKRRA